MDDLYSNLLVQYLYKECSERQGFQVEEQVQSDYKAKELLAKLREGKSLLNKYLPLHHPHKNSLKHILEYAKE